MKTKEKLETKSSENSKEKAVNDEDDSERKFRALSILSYFIVLFLLGLPIWWYTTRVYRATLPLDEIHQLKIKDTVSSEFGMPLGLDYDILISFVHPDPEKLDIKVNPLKIEEHLQDFLKEKLPVADFIVKSQWLYLTELGVNPKKSKDHYALSEDDLPHVITPLETKLWSNISPRPSVNLVIYFSHCGSPLYIYNSKKILVSTNSFISPRWGGIYIMNPDKNSCELGHFNPKSEIIALTFKEMLLKLFKIDSNATENAVEKFKLGKIQEMLESSKKTLKSLAQLLSEINSIVISDEVAEKINVAVKSVEQAEEFLKDGNQKEALLKAKLAFKNSEEAFGHPSLLALLYFPDDQKYAIYIPLFLPVMIPVIMSLTQIRKKHKLLL